MPRTPQYDEGAVGGGFHASESTKSVASKTVTIPAGKVSGELVQVGVNEYHVVTKADVTKRDTAQRQVQKAENEALKEQGKLECPHCKRKGRAGVTSHSTTRAKDCLYHGFAYSKKTGEYTRTATKPSSSAPAPQQEEDTTSGAALAQQEMLSMFGL